MGVTDDDDRLLLRAGRATGPGYAVDVTPERAGWRYSGLRVVELEPGATREIRTGADEVLVVPLAGGCTVEVDGATHWLTGRPDVFTAVTDHLYVPIGTTFTLRSAGGGRFALATARAERRLPVTYRGPTRCGSRCVARVRRRGR